MARPMTSLLDKEILLATDMIQPGADRWVGALVDCGNFVPAEDGRIVAWRAIDRRGQLFWLVVSRFEAMRYHATTASARAQSSGNTSSDASLLIGERYLGQMT